MTPTVEEIISLVPSIKKEDKDLIEKAYKFATKSHEGQKRKSGEPYFVHSVNTAKILAELGMAPVVIAAGLLHDVFEDTKTTREELRKEFGDEIYNLVCGVVKLGDIKYKGMERNVENLRKFFVSEAEDLRIIVIRLADRLHNVETLQYINPDKQKRIARETIEVYAPLADRLSMGKLKGNLEDAAFKFAYPDEYQEVKKLLSDKKDAKEKYLIESQDKIEQLIKEAGVKNTEVSSRQKHLYSLWKKLQKYDIGIDKIYDIIAMRIIVDSIEDCYLVFGLIHGEWTPMLNRIKDYIASPKQNGYRSLHTTIFTGTGGIIEIQVRTREMHEKAENGIAAHFAYKEKSNLENTSTKETGWAHELHNLNLTGGEQEKLHKVIKMDFFKDRIFVFTPKGDIVDLPKDSSVIDFAYAVHTSIGDHIQGAKINGKNSALNSKLKTNDIVEVQTNKNSKPSDKWLEYAKTNLAKKHIHNYLKQNSLLSRFLSFGKK